ncbi:hypothetical protein ACFYOF_22670 [Streptomyces sp. NPDC007148]|uniref:Transposase n=1 Tax=Streptomyces lannensis TaxID=766498 RepID=A0ABP7JNW6_9ACTN
MGRLRGAGGRDSASSGARCSATAHSSSQTSHGFKQQWFFERAFAHLHWFRRLRIRWEIRDDIHEAFLTLGCARICWRGLRALVSDAVG